MSETDLLIKAAQVGVGVLETGVSGDSQAEVVESSQQPLIENQVSAEIAVDQSVDAAQGAQAVQTEGVEPTVFTEQPDIWSEIAQKSEGLVKDEDSFKGVLEKIKNYDAIQTEKAELEKNQWKPVNEYVATLDKLIRDGATVDQIKAFSRLNDYGKIDDLNPAEAKIAKMVLIDGFSEDIARKIVNREFDFSQFDEDIPESKEEADILRERLRVSAKSDMEALKEYRKELSAVHNPEKEQVEADRLKQIADISAYNKTVEQTAGEIAKNFPSKLDYEFKVGEEVVRFEDAIEKDFLEKELPALVADYFLDSLDPLNRETITEAYSYAFGEYLKANDSRRLERAYQKGVADATEKTVNRYENRSGLPRAQENTVIAANEDGLIAFQKKLLGK